MYTHREKCMHTHANMDKYTQYIHTCAKPHRTQNTRTQIHTCMHKQSRHLHTCTHTQFKPYSAHMCECTPTMHTCTHMLSCMHRHAEAHLTGVSQTWFIPLGLRKDPHPSPSGLPSTAYCSLCLDLCLQPLRKRHPNGCRAHVVGPMRVTAVGIAPLCVLGPAWV